eukprot:365542-Chlamydomonas_euryale.AAC.47
MRCAPALECRAPLEHHGPSKNSRVVRRNCQHPLRQCVHHQEPQAIAVQAHGRCLTGQAPLETHIHQQPEPQSRGMELTAAQSGTSPSPLLPSEEKTWAGHPVKGQGSSMLHQA